jgi:hypothetical protein
MTTFAGQDLQDRLEEIEECERDAWRDYRDGLRDLAGRDYEDAEDDAWERLQLQLRDLAAERADLDAERTRRNL